MGEAATRLENLAVFFLSRTKIDKERFQSKYKIQFLTGHANQSFSEDPKWKKLEETSNFLILKISQEIVSFEKVRSFDQTLFIHIA